MGGRSWNWASLCRQRTGSGESETAAELEVCLSVSVLSRPRAVGGYSLQDVDTYLLWVGLLKSGIALLHPYLHPCPHVAGTSMNPLWLLEPMPHSPLLLIYEEKHFGGGFVGL